MDTSRLIADTAAAAALTGLTAGGYAYAGLWPTSRIFGGTIHTADPGTVALTYDDGPSPANTPALLDLLAAHNVHATFFLIGAHVGRYPDLARRIAAAGHTVGNHTQTHPNLLITSAAKTLAELTACQQTIFDVTGITPTLFRPPFGARRPVTLRIARTLGLAPVLWNVTGGDWKPNVTAETLTRMLRHGIRRNAQANQGSNLLLHDGSHLDTDTAHAARTHTVEATRALLGQHALRFVAL